jgi:hypothetical protein
VFKKRVFIVGGGPSLRGFDYEQLEKERTITVNASIFDVPSADYFITMDHSFLKKMRAKKKAFDDRQCSKVFVAGLHHRFLKEVRGTIIDTRFGRIYILDQFDVIIKSRIEHGCGFTLGDFRSGENSGFCGLQLAVLLGFDEIYLLGIDLCVRQNETHYHDLYPSQKLFAERLILYEKNFRRGLLDIKKQTDIKVISCSELSPINDIIPYMKIEDVL